MSETKYTEGVWYADNINSVVNCQEKGTLLTGMDSRGDLYDSDKNAANINLAAASPDLYEFAKKFVTASIIGCSKLELEDLRNDANKAISKALGVKE